MNVKALCRQDCDITDHDSVKTLFLSAGIVVNCAAWTDVDGAESDSDSAYLVNADAVRNLGDQAKRSGAYLVHIGSDYVFDGSGWRPWCESAPRNPVNCYGASKLAGELYLAACCPSAATLRVQWTYSLDGDDCVTRIQRLLECYPEVAIVDDQVGAPTPVALVACAVEKLVAKRLSGTYNFATHGDGSRRDLAIEIRRLIGVETVVKYARTKDFPTPAIRPLNTRLDCSRFDAEVGMKRPHWIHALRAEFSQKQKRESSGAVAS
jgi:dTDP-4-dehydrorhamnose reductase